MDQTRRHGKISFTLIGKNAVELVGYLMRAWQKIPTVCPTSLNWRMRNRPQLPQQRQQHQLKFSTTRIQAMECAQLSTETLHLGYVPFTLIGPNAAKWVGCMISAWLNLRSTRMRNRPQPPLLQQRQQHQLKFSTTRIQAMECAQLSTETLHLGYVPFTPIGLNAAKWVGCMISAWLNLQLVRLLPLKFLCFGCKHKRSRLKPIYIHSHRRFVLTYVSLVFR